MFLSRSIRVVYVGLLLSWAACFVTLGLWFAFEAPRITMLWLKLLSPNEVALIGIAMIASGNLIFMGWIADRLYPSLARSRLTWGVELGMAGVFATACTLLGVWQT